MTQPLSVTIPLLNPNEPEALLAALHIQEGQRVARGDPLCTLETTKSTAELAAEREGYVVGLRFQSGDLVQAGERLCYLASSAEWRPAEGEPQANLAVSEDLPPNLRITQPALKLAKERGINLSQLPIGPLITEKSLQSQLDRRQALEAMSLQYDFDPTAIIVYGGGGHGKSLIDMIRALGSYHIVGILDDGLQSGAQIMGLPVLGGKETLAELYQGGVRMAVNAVGGIGNIQIRLAVFKWLAETGYVLPTLVHPTALVEPSAVLSPGVQVFPHAYVGSEARIGFGAIINTGAIISHDCLIGDYVNISPGAILAGMVSVGREALIGMGATLNLEVQIGSGTRIGNGATVKSDVPERCIVRAGATWPE